jgi:hypothetical protein
LIESQNDTFRIEQLGELLDVAQDSVDELWRQDQVTAYPETRMRQLLDAIGNIC